MDIDKLRSFIEAYNSRSISAAADNLFISQSALSRRIQALESELKIELFQRSGTGLEPTEGGRMLYKEAGKILRQHDASLLKIKQLRKGHGGSLRIGVLQTIRQSPTIRAVSLMQAKYPDVELSFDCDINTNIPYRLAEKQIDVGITVLGEVQGIENMGFEILSENSLAVMMGKNHKLWKKRPLTIRDLDGETLYIFDATAKQANLSVEQYCKEQKVSFSDKIRCRSLEEQMLYLAKGTGVAITGLVASEVNSYMRDMIDIAPLEGAPLNQGYIVVVYDRDNELAGKFAALLKETW